MCDRSSDPSQHDQEDPVTAEPESLDAAWREAEAALPAGWGIGIEPSPRGYEVGAGRNQWHEWTGQAHPTLAAALQELASRLRDRNPVGS